MFMTIKNLITETLEVFYESFWPAVLIAVLCMVLYMYSEKHGGLKETVRDWLKEFRESAQYRRIFMLSLCVSLILVSTLLNRSYWSKPLSKVFDSWKIMNGDGTWNVDPVKNTVLFIPYIAVLFWALQDRVLKSEGLWATMGAAVKYGFAFSLTIELLQLILCLGTFQLSDLFYNTLGGLIGGLIYWCGHKMKHWNR